MGAVWDLLCANPAQFGWKWLCYLAGKSQMARDFFYLPVIIFLKLPLRVETHALTFWSHIILDSASVKGLSIKEMKTNQCAIMLLLLALSRKGGR